MVYVVNGVLASGMDMLLKKDLVGFALQKMEIHPLMLLTLSMIFQTFSPTLHNPSTNHTCVNYVGMTHHGYDCPPRFPLGANISNHTTEPSRCFNSFYDDDDYEESTIPLNDIVSQIPPSIAITPVLPTLEPEDSLSMGDEHLSTIPEKESDEVIKSSVEDLVPIPKGKSMTFSNPLFNSNDDFTSSDDESLSDEAIPEDNVKIYLNPLFEFDDEYIHSDVNILLFDWWYPGGDVDEIEFLLHCDPSTPKISVASILEGFTDEPPLEENDDLFVF
ncbi:hypothetical protein Tco_0785388 [Tanacetum coccineum]